MDAGPEFRNFLSCKNRGRRKEGGFLAVTVGLGDRLMGLLGFCWMWCSIEFHAK